MKKDDKIANSNKRQSRIQKLKKALGVTAFVSLIADICISAITLISLKVDKSLLIGILFVFNYILTAIVIIALIFMLLILIISHYHRLSKIISLFRFKTK